MAKRRDGVWLARIDSAIGQREVELRLEERSARSLSAVLVELGNHIGIDGQRRGDAIEFAGALTAATGEVRLSFNGRLVGDQLIGDADFGEHGGVGSWTAKRVPD